MDGVEIAISLPCSDVVVVGETPVLDFLPLDPRQLGFHYVEVGYGYHGQGSFRILALLRIRRIAHLKLLIRNENETVGDVEVV